MLDKVKVGDGCLIVNGFKYVPMDQDNAEYHKILDWINEGNLPEGADIIEPGYATLRTGPDGYASTGEQLDMQFNGTWEAHIASVKEAFPKSITGGTTIGEVPQVLLDAAADRLFNQQLRQYIIAVARLEQVQLAQGRNTITELQEQGGHWNVETGEWELNMVEVVIQSAIEAIPTTIQVWVEPEDEVGRYEIQPNPVITQDEAERSAAQVIIDATPLLVREAA